MIKLSPKTILKLVSLINEETAYRSGPQLVELFNRAGFREAYRWGGGAQSRSVFTREHLEKINGTTDLETVIKSVFCPREFSECPANFVKCMDALNSELQFDGWNIFLDESINEISFRRVKPTAFFHAISKKSTAESSSDDFLKKEFSDVKFDGIIQIPGVQRIVEDRLAELNGCLNVKAPLSAIFLTGSILEAVLLSLLTSRAAEFCHASSAPRDKEGKVLPITKWYLDAMINVAKDLGYLKEDVHRFCHVVKDFRNYIHPFEQNVKGFSPDVQTAKICLQVLKGAVMQIRERLGLM